MVLNINNSMKDIIEFKKNMLIRIEKITNYANEYIRKRIMNQKRASG